MIRVLLYIMLCLLWGSTWVAIKIGLESVPPFTGAVIRFLIAFILMALGLRLWRYHFPRYSHVKRDIFLIGLVMYGFSYSLTYWGLSQISSSLAAILFAAMPFSTAVLAHLLLPNDRLTPKIITGLVVGFLGIVILFSGKLEFSGSLLGMLAVIGSTLCAAWVSVKVKRDLNSVRPDHLVAISLLPGILWLSMMALLFEFPPLVTVDAKAIGSILYLAIIGTALTFITYFYLLKFLSPVVMSLIAFVTPLVAAFLGVIILNESLDIRFFIGACLILSGILVVSISRNRQTNRNPNE